MSSDVVVLKTLEVLVRGVGVVAVERLIEDPKYTLLLTSLSANMLVHPAAAVVGSSNSRLINVGNSVEFSAGPGEVKINNNYAYYYYCHMSFYFTA